jgi:hypothetical protein
MGVDPTPRPWAPPASSAPSAAEYHKFVQGLKILRVRFAKAAVYAPAIFIADPARRLLSATTRDARYLNFSRGFAATLEFRFRGWWEDDPASGVTAEAEVEVLYQSAALMTDEVFQRFKEALLPGHAWPYLREFLHSGLGRTGWPTHTLAVFTPASAANANVSQPGGLNE